jgi:hypothetical protein
MTCGVTHLFFRLFVPGKWNASSQPQSHITHTRVSLRGRLVSGATRVLCALFGVERACDYHVLQN